MSGSFHNSLRNVFVPKSSGGTAAAGNATSQTPVDGEAIRKKIEARRNYRKRTASEVLGIDSDGNATTTGFTAGSAPTSSHIPTSPTRESSSTSPRGSPSKSSSPRKASLAAEAGGHGPLRRSLPQTSAPAGGVSPSRRVFHQPATPTVNGQSAADQARDFLRHNLVRELNFFSLSLSLSLFLLSFLH